MLQTIAELNTILQAYSQKGVFLLIDAKVPPDMFMQNSDILCRAPHLTLTISEDKKDIQTVEQIWNFLIKEKATRQSLLVGIGGGVLTDIGGFAAATYKRGMDYLNIPTTLLSMVDAATGGKTAINFAGIKNAIGCFYQPIDTFIYTPFLNTLSERQMLSGYAEMIKHALLSSEQDLYSVVTAIEDTVECNNIPTQDMILHSIAVKQRFIQDDVTDKGRRQALNIGHTVGHAIEALSIENGTDMPHGYAVLYGLIAELYISSVRFGFNKDIICRLSHLMTEYYSRPMLSCRQYEKLFERMTADKKNGYTVDNNSTQDVKVVCSLLKAVGDVVIGQKVDKHEIFAALDFLFSI